MNQPHISYLHCAISSANQNHELLIALLMQQGFDGFEEKDNQLLAFVAKNQFDQEEFNQFVASNQDLINGYPQMEELQDINWNAKWESEYQPVIIDQTLMIKAPFHAANPNFEYVIEIEPKMSFGTGHHETTELMLELMLDLHFAGKTVLDMGCGTGVLGIFAAIRKAKLVTAIDFDPWSVENTIENAGKNNVKLEVILGSSDKINTEVDVILANINKNIILADMETYINHINPKGNLLLSGFLHSDLKDITQALTAHGYMATTILKKNDWAALCASRVELM